MAETTIQTAGCPTFNPIWQGPGPSENQKEFVKYLPQPLWLIALVRSRNWARVLPACTYSSV